MRKQLRERAEGRQFHRHPSQLFNGGSLEPRARIRLRECHRAHLWGREAADQLGVIRKCRGDVCDSVAELSRAIAY